MVSKRIAQDSQVSFLLSLFWKNYLSCSDPFQGVQASYVLKGFLSQAQGSSLQLNFLDKYAENKVIRYICQAAGGAHLSLAAEQTYQCCNALCSSRSSFSSFQNKLEAGSILQRLELGHHLTHQISGHSLCTQLEQTNHSEN